MNQGNVRNIQGLGLRFCLTVVANATRYIKNVGFTGGGYTNIYIYMYRVL